jgi:hypothetical protein
VVDSPVGSPFGACPNSTTATLGSGLTTTTFTLSGLAEGEHTIELKVVDAAGNDRYAGANRTLPLRHTWRVDTRPPIGLLTKWPAERRSAATTATFQFTADERECQFVCELDGKVGDVTGCECCSRATCASRLARHRCFARTTAVLCNRDAVTL